MMYYEPNIIDGDVLYCKSRNALRMITFENVITNDHRMFYWNSKRENMKTDFAAAVTSCGERLFDVRQCIEEPLIQIK